MKRLPAALLLASLFVAPSFAQTPQQTQQPAGAPTTTPPEHPATPEQIREYFKVVHLDQTVHNLIEQMLKAMQATSAPYFPASLWEDMHKTLSGYDFLSELVPVYQEYLSSSDMDATLAFYRSPSGQRLLAAQPKMVAETQAKFRAIGQRLGEEVAARHIDEIKAAEKKYQEENAKPDSSHKPQ